MLMLAGSSFAAEPRKTGEYPLTIDSYPQPGVAKGQLIGPIEFHSRIIANTVRRYWIYVPAGYDANNPPNLLVWQDAQRAIPESQPLRIPIVLDNLIAKKEIPPTLGIFITPGNLGTEHYPDNLGTGNPNHRAQEYDQMSDDYSQFLIQEMLPEVAKRYKFTGDPNRRLIGGTSSGAICAFTASGSTALRAARERPEAPILSLTPSVQTARRMAVVWGVHAVTTPEVHSMTETVQRASRTALAEGVVPHGSEIVVIAGLPFGQAGTTNALRVAHVK